MADNYFLPEIYGGLAPKSTKTSTDSVYGGSSVGSRTGAFQEAASKNDGYSTGGITPTAQQIAQGAARAGGQNPMSGEEIAKDFAKTREAAKDVAVGLVQPFIRPGAQLLAPTIEKFVNSPVVKDFTGAPEDKDFKFPDVNYRGQSLYKQDYGVGDAVSDAAWIAATTVPWVKGGKAVASAAKAGTQAAKGKKLVSETEKVLKEAANKGPDAIPPSGGVSTAPTAPKTPPSRPITKTDIAAGKYGTVAGEMSSGSGISTRTGTATPTSIAGGQQFAQAANRSSAALGETTRSMGVSDTIVLPKTPTTVTAPKAQVPKTPTSIRPSEATNPFTEAAASAASAAAKGASRVSQAISAGTTGSVIRDIANQSSSTTPPSGMGPQFITRSGLEIWARPGAGTPKPSEPYKEPVREPAPNTDIKPKPESPEPKPEPQKSDDPRVSVPDPIKTPSQDPIKPPPSDGGGAPPSPKLDEPTTSPRDEEPRRRLPATGSVSVKSPADFARIPYIP